MIKIVKSEWHQVEKRYGIKIDKEILTEVYPDLSYDEIDEKYEAIKSGEIDADEFLADADEVGVEFDWDWLDEDDWWTDRKGGYEVTYAVEGEE